MIPCHNPLIATVSGNLLDILTKRHAQDEAHCLPANFLVRTGLHGRRHRKESSIARNLTRKALGERSHREYPRVSIKGYPDG